MSNASTGECLIKVSQMNKVFRLGKLEIHALRDINLEVYDGEYLSIMGPSGSGKSTLFNMIGALDVPTSGEVDVSGVDLTKLTSRQLAYFRGNYIGYVFQSYNLIYAYSAIENVALPLIFSGVPLEDARKKAEETLHRVGLGHRVTHRPDELSGGQQQRVAIARALANDPLIILADEPTANLDIHTGQEIIHLMAELSEERGVTVISATHDHKMLAQSDRILWIKDGTVDRIDTDPKGSVKVGSIR
ncbi:MAG: ABC transporter ATP-binding protein [Opitutales bacterium]